MKVVFSNNRRDIISQEFESNDIVIPRNGESVFCGYTPAPSVIHVGYNFQTNQVIIVLDTPFGKDAIKI